jgi:hypothetical protein
MALAILLRRSLVDWIEEGFEVERRLSLRRARFSCSLRKPEIS